MLEREVYQEEEVYDMGGMGDPHDDEDEDDDEDETLSFCDLPIYYVGDDAEKESASNNQSSSQSSFSSSLNDNEEDCFDFSFSSSQTLQEKNIIIFCGKIIKPNNINSSYYCKELVVLKDNNKSTTSSSSTPKTKGTPPAKEKKTCHTKTAKYKNKTSKWYLLMLGLVRIHQGGNMELKDIKKRQTKRSHGSRLEVANNKSHHSAGSSSGDIDQMKAAGRNNNNNKAGGLLSLLSSFSCTRISPTNGVHLDYCKVKASLWWLQQLPSPH